MTRRLHRLLLSIGLAMAIAVFGLVNGRPTTVTQRSDSAPPAISLEPTTAPIISPTSTLATSSTNATVLRVVDGDTLDALLDGENTEFKIRLLGINTPETVDPRRPVECFGKEASAHMHELTDGKRVRLDADPQAYERDKYGRLLRNLFLADGTDVNASMVRDGYAYAYLSFPLNPARKRELKQLEEDAKMAGRGLWGGCKR